VAKSIRLQRGRQQSNNKAKNTLAKKANKTKSAALNSADAKLKRLSHPTPSSV
jgi:hypothetical protein